MEIAVDAQQVIGWAGGTLVTLGLSVVGYFLRQVAADARTSQADIADLRIRVAVIENRENSFTELREDLVQMRKDIVWMRERLASLTARQGP